MPQKSLGYAVGRVRVLEQGLLNRQSMERLLSAQSVEELLRALSEVGWGEAQSKNEVDRLANQHVADACALMREISPEPAVTDCFLYKYDAMNLKVLIKARTLGITDARLSPNGTIAPEKLRRMVEEHRYQDLPVPFRDAMNAIEARLALSVEPMAMDAELDRALGTIIEKNLQGKKNEIIKRYFADRADVINMLSALRCNRIGQGKKLAMTLFMPGGEVPFEKMALLAEDPSNAYSLIERRAFARPMREALQKGDLDALAEIEKLLDDHLLNMIRAHRHETLSIMPIIGYYIAREREASTVRLIATAKDAHVPEEKLKTRLREMYA